MVVRRVHPANQRLPLLRPPLRYVSGLVGSPTHEFFGAGQWEYLRFVLQKQASGAG
jgi:hypothetical protein